MSSRKAKLSRVGCAVFISSEELETLGINPEKTDAVEYSIQNGELQFQNSGEASDV